MQAMSLTNLKQTPQIPFSLGFSAQHVELLQMIGWGCIIRSTGFKLPATPQSIYGSTLKRGLRLRINSDS